MRVSLKKDVKLDEKTLLHKNTQGTLIAVKWADTGGDKYYIQIKDNRYTIDKQSCELY